MKAAFAPLATPHALPTSAIRSLKLSHFRNYRNLALEADPRPVVLIGPNGAGKTNVLEAISFLSPGRGFRRAQLRDVDYAGASAPFAVAAEVETKQGLIAVGTARVDQEGVDKRLVKIDGKQTKNQEELASILSVIWLLPQMDTLLQESGSTKRRFLDRLVYGFDPQHARRINAYEEAVRERNALLAGRHADTIWLEALEARIAGEGAAISATRQEVLERLNEAMGWISPEFPKARLSMEGEVDGWLREMPALQAEERYKAVLAEARLRDRHAGRATFGAHRSQFTVFHIEKEMVADRCSTGEQKALLLAILLADIRARTLSVGQPPILLLDEVAAHLDHARNVALLKEICEIGAQAWMTGTALETFAELKGKAQFFEVDSGTLRGM